MWLDEFIVEAHDIETEDSYNMSLHMHPFQRQKIAAEQMHVKFMNAIN